MIILVGDKLTGPRHVPDNRSDSALMLVGILQKNLKKFNLIRIYLKKT